MEALEGRKNTGIVCIKSDTLVNLLHLLESGNVLFCGRASFIQYCSCCWKWRRKKTPLLLTPALVSGSVYVCKGLPEDGINSSIFSVFAKECWWFCNHHSGTYRNSVGSKYCHVWTLKFTRYSWAWLANVNQLVCACAQMWFSVLAGNRFPSIWPLRLEMVEESPLVFCTVENVLYI